MSADSIEKALRRAFSLGQTYWQQADSDSYKQNAKARETLAKYDTLVEETVALLQPTPAPTGEEAVAFPNAVVCVAEEGNEDGYSDAITERLPTGTVLYTRPAPAADAELLRNLISYAESGKVAEPHWIPRMKAMLAPKADGRTVTVPVLTEAQAREAFEKRHLKMYPKSAKDIRERDDEGDGYADDIITCQWAGFQDALKHIGALACASANGLVKP